mgnify:FL=1
MVALDSLLVTTWFVADPALLDAASDLFAARVAAIPPGHATVHFLSAYPESADDPGLLASLRETAVHEGLDPDPLELFTVQCVLSLDPEHEETVRQQLFFCGPTERDPFPGFQTHVNLRRC